MKSIVKATVALYMAVYSCLLHDASGVLNHHALPARATANESSMLVDVPECSLWLPSKIKAVNDIEFNKPVKAAGFRTVVQQNTAADSRIRSYLLLNDTKANLALIPYKFPVANHTEAG